MNVVGTMYRPKKVISLNEKRGFRIIHRFRSTFGQIIVFSQDIHLVYDVGTETEHVQIDFSELDMPIRATHKHMRNVESLRNALMGEDFPARNILNGMKKPTVVKSFRKMRRPEYIFSNKTYLRFGLGIYTATTMEESDLLAITMSLEVINGKEIILFETICNTPVIVTGVEKA